MKNNSKKLAALVAFAVLITTSSCVKKVTRVSTDQTIDISGRWNDTDSRLVAEAMIEDLLTARWLQEFIQKAEEVVAHSPSGHYKNKKKPIIVIGDIKNKSFEHIEGDTFIKDIERNVINNGTIRVIANSTFREKLRSERSSQAGFAATESQKSFGRELGADYMMFGSINTIVDASEDDRVIFYQINLELVDLETNEVVWIGEKKIKKYKSKTGRVRNSQKG